VVPEITEVRGDDAKITGDRTVDMIDIIQVYDRIKNLEIMIQGRKFPINATVVTGLKSEFLLGLEFILSTDTIIDGKKHTNNHGCRHKYKPRRKLSKENIKS